ncbi:acylaminoacyl-peptidase [Sphingobium indicum BiD32]|uniref:Acylaminoacyl-peptidase n=1 Tax=Sphingobium indicum BiD32 TaxID=1301087 RepID=N1MWM1_9SPHN|nr:Atxe2 family lasso peptide isopeptidase [Sphingobium indicum]CCW19663.1 acylaminoacyl-peptidase [Sphingobium indicum BiD32]
MPGCVPAGSFAHFYSCHAAILAAVRQKIHLSYCPILPGHLSSGWSLVKTQCQPGSYNSPTRLVATSPSGKALACDHPDCLGNLFFDIEGAWETDRPGEFAFLKREGWGGSMLGLFLWQPGHPPHRLLTTEDLLVGCEGLGQRLVCARESARQPRHLMTLDLRDHGRSRTLFDPNPDFQRIALGSAQRLHWRNDRGQESYGDLVLPPRIKPGQKLPLVIVQYVTRGFLRGGTGDEYPIQLFARNGFAVLSFQKPAPLFAAEGNDGTLAAILPRLNSNWDDRRDIHSSLMVGIRSVLARSDIDPDRIGISGVSDGSTTMQFGLINSPGLFKAASVGSCCVDPTAMMIYGGSGLAHERTAWGYPPASGPGSEAWKPLSLPVNSPELMAPLLMQLADNEFLVAMETLAAYQRNKRPVEARIFPQEFHLKVQPEHRLNIYCRNLRWFGFWLDQPIASVSCPPDARDVERWSAMKAIVNNRPSS